MTQKNFRSNDPLKTESLLFTLLIVINIHYVKSWTSTLDLVSAVMYFMPQDDKLNCEISRIDFLDSTLIPLYAELLGESIHVKKKK